MARPKAKTKKPAVKRTKPKRRMTGTCMVLTPFKEPFDTYFLSIIKPAVNAAKLEAIRGDSLFRPSPIMADVWQMIQDAKVLVADLTEKNANVFYELGLAHAVGKPVVLLADNLADVPFDLQPLRVIIYDKNEPAWGDELKASITESVRETLADAASAVPAMFRKVIRSQAPPETRAEHRLDMLERQIASLAAGEKGLSLRLRSPSELYRLRRWRWHAPPCSAAWRRDLCLLLLGTQFDLGPRSRLFTWNSAYPKRDEPANSSMQLSARGEHVCGTAGKGPTPSTGFAHR